MGCSNESAIKLVLVTGVFQIHVDGGLKDFQTVVKGLLGIGEPEANPVATGSKTNFGTSAKRVHRLLRYLSETTVLNAWRHRNGNVRPADQMLQKIGFGHKIVRRPVSFF